MVVVIATTSGPIDHRARAVGAAARRHNSAIGRDSAAAHDPAIGRVPK